MTRAGLTAVAMVLPFAVAMAERPPLQEMQLPPVTTPGQPQPQPSALPQWQPPAGSSLGQAQARPSAGPAPLQTPSRATAQPPGQPDLLAAPVQGQSPDLLLGPNQNESPTQAEAPTDTPGSLQDQPLPSVTAAQPQWPNVWVSAGSAKIQALDKVNAQATTLTVRVGQPATFGSLTISVKSCVVRPPDQPSDAAAYLNVTDSHPDSPGFDGWMLANEPSVSMMQNPIYDLRVAGCG